MCKHYFRYGLNRHVIRNPKGNNYNSRRLKFFSRIFYGVYKWCLQVNI